MIHERCYKIHLLWALVDGFHFVPDHDRLVCEGRSFFVLQARGQVVDQKHQRLDKRTVYIWIDIGLSTEISYVFHFLASIT